MNELYKRLKEIRKSRGFTQEELAEKADISRVMVSRYETGSVIPTLDVLINLADALDVSIDYLLGRSDDTKFVQGTRKHRPPLLKNTEGFPENKEELRKFVLDTLKDSIHFKY